MSLASRPKIEPVFLPDRFFAISFILLINIFSNPISPPTPIKACGMAVSPARSPASSRDIPSISRFSPKFAPAMFLYSSASWPAYRPCVIVSLSLSLPVRLFLASWNAISASSFSSGVAAPFASLLTESRIIRLAEDLAAVLRPTFARPAAIAPYPAEDTVETR